MDVPAILRLPAPADARLGHEPGLSELVRFDTVLPAMDRQLASRVSELYRMAFADANAWERSLDGAADALRAHLLDEPDCVQALTSLGAVLSDRGRHREALSILRRAESLRSADANTYYNLAVALMNLGARERGKAPDYFAKARSLEPSPLTMKAYFDPHGH